MNFTSNTFKINVNFIQQNPVNVSFQLAFKLESDKLFVESINLVTTNKCKQKALPRQSLWRVTRGDRRDNAASSGAPQIQRHKLPFSLRDYIMRERVKCQAEPTGARRADNGASAAWLDPTLRTPQARPRSLCTPVTRKSRNLDPTFHFINLFVAARREKEPASAPGANLQRHRRRLSKPEADFSGGEGKQEVRWEQNTHGQQT